MILIWLAEVSHNIFFFNHAACKSKEMKLRGGFESVSFNQVDGRGCWSLSRCIFFSQQFSNSDLPTPSKIEHDNHGFFWHNFCLCLKFTVSHSVTHYKQTHLIKNSSFIWTESFAPGKITLNSNGAGVNCNFNGKFLRARRCIAYISRGLCP